MTIMESMEYDRLRAFHVEFFGPTNHRGARVRVKDMRNNKRVFLSYDYEIGDILRQALAHLKQVGIEPKAVLLHDAMGGYTIGSKDFSTDLISES